jgi:very-short-patch-repair endonuclease
VVFLSLVDGPPESGLLTTRSAGPRDLYKKRYNVAASRARNQLWVVHSLDPELHLNNGDLRKRLIDHARDPLQLMNRMEQLSKRTESEFEKQVLQRLIRAGYRTATQWRVGSFRIDIVVQGANGKKLAIECDGERWHTAEQLQKDLERQAILERLGWVFRRIRGSLFFRDAEAAMVSVFEKLASMEIAPIAESNSTDAPTDSELMNELRARAEEILASRAAGSRSNAETNNGE